MSWPHIFFKRPSPTPVPVTPAADEPTVAKKAEKAPPGDSVAEAMAKADPLRELSRAEGGVRLTRRIVPEEPSVPLVSEPTKAVEPEVTPPAVAAPEEPFLKPSETQLSAAAAPEQMEKPAEAPPASPVVATEAPTPAPVRRGGLFGFRRKARMTEVARILPTPPEPQPDPVSPPSFTINTTAGEVLDKKPEAMEEKSFVLVEEKPPEKPGESVSPDAKPEETKPVEDKPGEVKTEETETPKVIQLGPELEPVAPAKPEAKAPEPSFPTATTEIAPTDAKPKSELILANGERVMGRILSETPEALYVEHGALGVLTIPRAQIAQKPIEVILINGDRIVGDLIAENAECLYVRHASLGMLTVPHNQRSTRVVEVILRDGDRILGEVLAETATYTVLRSATLGTVTVQHDRIALMNRKLEQMPLKALPPALEAPKPPAQV